MWLCFLCFCRGAEDRLCGAIGEGAYEGGSATEVCQLWSGEACDASRKGEWVSVYISSGQFLSVELTDPFLRFLFQYSLRVCDVRRAVSGF